MRSELFLGVWSGGAPASGVRAGAGGVEIADTAGAGTTNGSSGLT